jgi:hypothetical protein
MDLGEVGWRDVDWIGLARPLWSSGQSSWLQNGDVLCFLWCTNWIYICYVEESRPPLWPSGQSSWLQNGDVLCFLWGMNWIYICYVEESRPPLWPSGQSFWLQIQRSKFDSRRYQAIWEVVGLECGPLSLVSTTEKLLGRKSCGSGLESREYGCRDPSRWPRGTLYFQKLTLTSPTSGGRSTRIICSRTQATEFSFSQISDSASSNYKTVVDDELKNVLALFQLVEADSQEFSCRDWGRSLYINIAVLA